MHCWAIQELDQGIRSQGTAGGKGGERGGQGGGKRGDGGKEREGGKPHK